MEEGVAGGVNGSNGSTSSHNDELAPRENFLCICSRELLARGCEMLKHTRTASNVLLDGNMEPKISDFGLARMFGGEQTTGKTNLAIGTYGYMSPEYALDGLFSIKSYIYNFGVLLLEIISGQSNRRFYHPDHDFNLLGHAWKYWNEGRALEIQDTSMEGQFPRGEASRILQISLVCVQKQPENWPAMSVVVMILENQNADLPEPKQHGFFTERNLNDNDSPSGDRNINATNELTITMLQVPFQYM